MIFKTLPLLLGLFFVSPCSSMAQDLLRGRASYYADRFHGRTMSNGKPYNKDSMTCAHLTLPFGTFLRVRNMQNGKEVTVEVTDRGPYSRFIIDLSRAAATELDFIRAGHVKIEAHRLYKRPSPYRLDEEISINKCMLPNYLPYIRYGIPTPRKGKLKFPFISLSASDPRCNTSSIPTKNKSRYQIREKQNNI